MFNKLVEYNPYKGYETEHLDIPQLSVYSRGSDTPLLYPFFKVKEFDDYRNYDCKYTLISHKLVRCLGYLREYFRAPLYITSAFRSEETNRRVGGASGSFHLFGMAADFYLGREIDLKEVLEIARTLEDVGGLGYYKTNGLIHLDVRNKGKDNILVEWEG